MVKRVQKVVSAAVVCLGCAAAVVMRYVTLKKYGPTISEYDSHFNWRCVNYVASRGLREFYAWFDGTVWYPFGRSVGTTVYPGMFAIFHLVWRMLHCLRLRVSLLDLIVHSAPVLGVSAVVSIGAMGARRDRVTGLLCLVLAAYSPVLIGGSTAGMLDYECWALPLMVVSLCNGHTFVRGGDRGALAVATATSALASAVWGGAVFVPIILSLWSLMGPRRRRIEFCSFFVFSLLVRCCVVPGFDLLSLPEAIPCAALLVGVTECMLGCRWPALALLPLCVFLQPPVDRYSQAVNPRTAVGVEMAVQEQLPASWSAWGMYFGPLLLLAPIGAWVLRRDREFLVWLVLSVALGAAMVRLLVLAAPPLILACAAAVRWAWGALLAKRGRPNIVLAVLVMAMLVATLNMGVGLAFGALAENHVVVGDDGVRAGYGWLANNAPDARVVALWDAGYQIASLGRSRTFADGWTANRTRLAEIDALFRANERDGWAMARAIEATHVVVLFGGGSGVRPDTLDKVGAGTESLVARLAWYRFSRFDRARRRPVRANYSLRFFREAFTSSDWLVRVFEVMHDELEWGRTR